MKAIQLTRGKVALVDDEDFERLSNYEWHACIQKCRQKNIWYAKRTVYVRQGVWQTVQMHREILGLQPGDGILADHRDLDGLNNQKSNLRVCTKSQNCSNTNGRKRRGRFKGARQHTGRSKPWMSQITINRKTYNLGYFYTEEAAALAYNEAAKINFGEFARLNQV